jgi:hypothetical protein
MTRYIEDYLALTKPYSNAFDPSSSGYTSGPSFMESVKAGEELFGPGGSLSSDSSGGYQSQFGKWADAFSLANKHKQGSSVYQGGWAQPFAQGSGANVTPMGSGKWMHQFEPGKIAGIVHHPQKQKKRGILGTLGGIATGLAGVGVLGPWGMAAGMGAQALDA